jgi:hypothetical protein
MRNHTFSQFFSFWGIHHLLLNRGSYTACQGSRTADWWFQARHTSSGAASTPTATIGEVLIALGKALFDRAPWPIALL